MNAHDSTPAPGHDATSDRPTHGTILSLEQLAERRAGSRRSGERVVHCHGCFDIVHPGHVRHLQHARSLGDRLLVTITADEHIAKGPGRPLFNERLRAENLAALSCVDWVAISPDPTAESLLERVRPDIYVKGREYETNDDPRFARERAIVEDHGGRVVFSSGDVVFSSSALVGAMLQGGGESSGRMEDPTQARLRTLRERHGLTIGRLSELVRGNAGRRVVVIGETIIDSYVRCAWPEVSGESPVLSLRPIDEVRYDGGSAVIALHAAALGARPELVTALPESDEAEAFIERMDGAGVRVHAIRLGDAVPLKQRYVVGREKVAKIDHTRPYTVDAGTRGELVELAASLGHGADAAILADYGLGLFGARTASDLCRALRPRVRVLAGDVSGGRSTLTAMRDVDWLSPTERELRWATGQHQTSLPATAWELANATGARTVTVTMASDGLIAFTRPEAGGTSESGDPLDTAGDGMPSRLIGEHIPALCANPADTLGCGDALLTAGVLALSAGASVVEAAYLGSLAAGVAAAQPGNPALDATELLRTARWLDESPLMVHTVAEGFRLVS